MNWIITALLSISLLISSPASYADTKGTGDKTTAPDKINSPITPFYVEYDVGNNLINAGIAKLSLHTEGDEWIYSLKTEPSGIFRLSGKGRTNEVSVIHVSDSKLIPKSYTFQHKGEEKRRNVEADFNWESKELTIRHRGKDKTKTLKDPILDRLSVTLALMEQTRLGFSKVEIQVLDSGKIKKMIFVNDGAEILDTKLGKLKTIRVRRISPGAKRVTVTWFAPELNYVPVQIEQLKKGKLVARLKINKLRQDKPQ